MTEQTLPKLDSRESRNDLTDRECVKLIGGLVGALLQSAPPVFVARALRWWALLPHLHPDVWAAMATAKQALAEMEFADEVEKSTTERAL